MVVATRNKQRRKEHKKETVGTLVLLKKMPKISQHLKELFSIIQEVCKTIPEDVLKAKQLE